MIISRTTSSRIRTFALLLVAIGMVLGFAVLPPVAPAAANTSGVDEALFKEQIFAGVNQHRAKQGTPALKSSRHLNKIAQDWANKVAAGTSDAAFRHNPDYSTLIEEAEGWSAGAENIARGSRDGNAVMRLWIGSDGHRKNIEGEYYTHLGIGVAASKRFGVVYVQVFGVNESAPDDKMYLPPKVDRIGGANRYETAINISRHTHGSTAPVVYIASGQSYPDALTAVPAAALEGAPILLTPTHANQVPAILINRLKELNPSKIVIVGGPGAVNDGARKKFQAAVPKATVKRISGADRYETSRAVVTDAFGNQRGGSVFIATGRDFPDALSISTIAANGKSPVLLVNGTQRTLDKASLEVLNTLQPSTIIIAGGTGAVSTEIEQQLRRIADVSRLAGADRYETSIAISRPFYQGPRRVVMATGLDFPDALTGALFAVHNSAPLYITRTSCNSAPLNEFVRAAGHATLIGGTGVLTQDVASLKRC